MGFLQVSQMPKFALLKPRVAILLFTLHPSWKNMIVSKAGKGVLCSLAHISRIWLAKVFLPFEATFSHLFSFSGLTISYLFFPFRY